MAQAKIAFICPVGPLDKWGYQNSFPSCLINLSEFADQLYLVNSDYNNEMTRLEPYRFNRQKVTWISTPNTWFNRKTGWNAVQYANNIRVGCERAREDGYDVAVNVSCNWYAPLSAQVIMEKWWQYMVDTGEPYDQIYVRYQVGHHLMGASVCFCSALNLRIKNTWQFTATDGLTNHVGHELFAVRKNWSKYNHVSFVDTGYELSLDDLRDKLNFVRCYSDLIPSRSPEFDWTYWHDYYRAKVGAMPRSDDILIDIGKDIADRGDETFLSRILEKELEL